MSKQKNNMISMEVLQEALNSVPEYVAIKDMNGMYVYANSAVDELYKGKFDSIVGLTVEEIYPPEEVAFIRELDQRVIKSKEGFSEPIEIHSEKGMIHVEISRFPVFNRDSKLEYIISIANNVEDKYHLQEQLKQKVIELQNLSEKYMKLSYVDSLTQVYNRRKLFEDIEQSSKNINLQLILFDINNFKLINDQLGHSIGDEVLKKFGQILNEFSSKYWVTVYRFGGDEFVTLCNVSDFPVEVLIERLDDMLSKYHKDCSVAYGVAKIKDFNSDSKGLSGQLLNEADKLLYKFKSKVRTSPR